MTEALKAVVVNKYSLCPIFETLKPPLCVPLGNDQPVSVCHHNKQVRCCFGPPDKRRPSRRAGECAFKCFLTWWRSIMAKLWKSPRRPASAYAHYLWEHAGSWLPFTKAGTQGQREWEWKVCVCACTPSDETLPLLCVYGRFLRAWLSCYGDPVSPCVLTCLLSILFSKIAYIDCLLQVDGNVLPLFSALAASKLLQPCLVSAPLRI